MSSVKPAFQMVYSDDGSAAAFEVRLPHRGMGKFLMIASLLGVLMVAVSIIGLVSVSRGGPGEQQVAVAFLCFGLVATAAFFLPGLYLATRRMRVALNHREVLFEKRWALRGSSRRVPLAEYLGLHRFSKQVGTMDGGTVAATVAGVAAAALIGYGAVFGKTAVIHFLQLKHRNDSALDALLAADTDPAVIREAMAQLAERFSLNIVDPTLDGFTARQPDPLKRSSDEQAASSRPVDGAPPTGIQVHDDGATKEISLPASPMPLVAGIAVGLPLLCIAGAVALFGGDGQRKVSPAAAAVPLLLGGAVIAIGFVNAKRRTRVVLNAAGISYQMAAAGSQPQQISWGEIEHVATAKQPTSKKPCLLVVTKTGDQWLPLSSRVEVLDWLRLVMLTFPKR